MASSDTDTGSLSLQNVTKTFGKTVAVDNVDLDIRRGEFLTLLGPSGSGKTTLLMMIAGFLDISNGDILLDGNSIADIPAEKRNFGMVFQGYALFPHMSVRKNISYALDVRKRPQKEIDARVDEMLELVQLQQYGERLPVQLSGGQQQRVALARALSFSPPILLLDEPLGALDKKLRVEVQEQLKDIHTRVGTTFIYVTHDQEEALSMSDRIVIMQEGREEQVGTPLELYEKPRTRFAASFLGKSNFLERESGTYALRPEKIDIAPKGAANGDTENSLQATVKSITYFGSMKKYIVETNEGQELEVDVDSWRNQFPLEQGNAVDISWREAAVVKLEG
ncbi:MAG: ABC transporter ATP-binding protein [Hyphomicrobiales bacterium]